jgi:hypothetical protein
MWRFLVVKLAHISLNPRFDMNIVFIVDVVSSDILSRNGKNATIQDQSQGRTRRIFRLIRALRRVKTLRPVLLYYEM